MKIEQLSTNLLKNLTTAKDIATNKLKFIFIWIAGTREKILKIVPYDYNINNIEIEEDAYVGNGIIKFNDTAEEFKVAWDSFSFSYDSNDYPAEERNDCENIRKGIKENLNTFYKSAFK